MALITSSKALIDKTWKLFVRQVKSCAFASNNSLSWLSRIIILGIFAGVATYVTREWAKEIAEYLLKVTLKDIGITLKDIKDIKDIRFLSLVFFIFGFVFSIGTWIIRTHDRKKEFQDSLHTQKDSLQTRNETLFQNAVEMVINGEVLAMRVLALRQLARLKHRGVIEKVEIDQITDSGLKLCISDKSNNQGQSIIETANLASVDLSYMVLSEVDLQGANLQDANLQDADLQGANLQYANLQYANLQRAKLQHTNLEDADLEDTNLQHADLEDTNLQDANLRGANLQNADLQNADLQNADLQNADLQATNLQDANLQDANLLGAHLQRANLRDADLQHTDLRGAHLQHTNVLDADLQHADLRGANLEKTNLQDAELKDSKYNSNTIFPAGFDPEKHGMKKQP